MLAPDESIAAAPYAQQIVRPIGSVSIPLASDGDVASYTVLLMAG
jgi:hypothetical protein